LGKYCFPPDDSKEELLVGLAEYSIVAAVVIGIVGAVDKNEIRYGSEETTIKNNPPQNNKMAVIAKKTLEFFNGAVVR
jgi:predicted DNA-binding protein with PD1-like motif